MNEPELKPTLEEGTAVSGEETAEMSSFIQRRLVICTQYFELELRRDADRVGPSVLPASLGSYLI